MNYKTSAQAAVEWGVSEQYVRKLCRQGRIEGSIIDKELWLIPANAKKPGKIKTGPRPKPIEEINPPKLLKKLLHQRDGRNYSGLYDYSLINMAYSSCRMASGRLTREQITLILQKDKILTYNERIKVNDIIEARNHLRAFDMILDTAIEPLTPDLLLSLHKLLLSDSCDHKRKEVITGEFRASVPKIILKHSQSQQKSKQISLCCFVPTNPKNLFLLRISLIFMSASNVSGHLTKLMDASVV